MNEKKLRGKILGTLGTLLVAFSLVLLLPLASYLAAVVAGVAWEPIDRGATVFAQGTGSEGNGGGGGGGGSGGNGGGGGGGGGGSGNGGAGNGGSGNGGAGNGGAGNGGSDGGGAGGNGGFGSDGGTAGGSQGSGFGGTGGETSSGEGWDFGTQVFSERVPVSDTPFAQPKNSVPRSEARAPAGGRLAEMPGTSQELLTSDEERAAIMSGWGLSRE